MLSSNNQISLVTAVLPAQSADAATDRLVANKQSGVYVSKARGTLLHEHWYKSWFPPISPSKTMLRMIVSTDEVDPIISNIVAEGKLHLQASGAVFNTPCEYAYIGPDFHGLQSKNKAITSAINHQLCEKLSVIFCSVGHQLSDRIAKAAINAGAHGPIVYYSEGRGLRDKLGWLRITKDSEQEVLMVIADEADVDDIFDAMAKAGEFHLPGRGFMYRLPIDKGMFNIPSRVCSHHYEASTQQIINAIDHLTGHTHWRDQTIFDVGDAGKGSGIEILQKNRPELTNQVCFTTIVNRDQCQNVIDLMLDAGVPGLNVNYARLVEADAEEHFLANANINLEYAFMRCIMDHDTAEVVSDSIESNAGTYGFKDVCVLAHKVPRIAKYVHGATEYRSSSMNLSSTR